MGVSVFTDSLIAVLGLGRSAISLAYLVGTTASALLLTSAGRLYDRLGVRLMGVAVLVFLALQLVFLSRLEGIIPWFSGPFGPFIVITVSFFVLRFFGQGILTLISRNMVMKWFEVRRGLANAVMGTFVSFGFAYAPRLFNALIERHRWDGAYLRLGLFLGTVGVLSFLIFARDNPAACGLQPDGGIRELREKKLHREFTGPEHDFTLKEARRTLSFWVFSLSIGLSALIATAMTFHVVSIFDVAGMSRDQAVAMFLPASFVSVILNFIANWLSDHVKLRYILIVYLLGQAITLAALITLGAFRNPALLIAGYGIQMGLQNVISTITWPRYFGLTHLGAISGMAMAFMVVGSAAGPYLYSLSLDATGLYHGASWLCLGISAVLLVLTPWVRKP